MRFPASARWSASSSATPRKKSNSVLHQLGPDIQWVQSYVTQDRLYCIYLATDAALIKKHADISGFPASKITETRRVIDPTTAAQDAR